MSSIGPTYGHSTLGVHFPPRPGERGEGREPGGGMRCDRRFPSFGRLSVRVAQALKQPFGPPSPGLARRRRGPWAWLCALVVLSAFALQSERAAARPLLIVALGDSLTAGLGLPAEESFPAVLQKALRAKGYDVEVANAGVSGDTAADGLARFDWAVPDGADAAIVELGANDMLRGLDPAAAEKSLGEILGKLQARHVATLIAGMRAAPNLGADYQARFDAIYADLARQYGAALYPFFLDGVAADPKLNQKDGLHPTAGGVEVIVAKILPAVEALIAKARP
jgi:acyl-CoA thioesterase-1